MDGSNRGRITERDAASRRVRRLTLNTGVVAAGFAGLLAAFVASKAHGRTVAQTTATAATRSKRSVPVVPAPTATVGSKATATAASGSATRAAPQPAPAPASAAPTVVSGGS